MESGRGLFSPLTRRGAGTLVTDEGRDGAGAEETGERKGDCETRLLRVNFAKVLELRRLICEAWGRPGVSRFAMRRGVTG